LKLNEQGKQQMFAYFEKGELQQWTSKTYQKVWLKHLKKY
jgi:hypothetical protein